MNTLPSPALLIYFKDYEQYHRNPGNKLTHLFGIPLVLFSLVGLLAKVVVWSAAPDSLFPIDLGLMLMAFGGLFALRVDWKLGIPFCLYAYLNYLVARHLGLSALLVLQISGWILQLVGHFVYEKKSPAFLTSLEHLFIGPMWIFAWIIRYYRPTT